MKKRRLSLPALLTCTLLIILPLIGLGAYWEKRHINLAFISAAADGDIQTVREELDAGVPPDGPQWQGLTAMRWACYNGREEVVKLLLSKGANPQGGMHDAKIMGYPKIVRLLQQAGAKE